MDMAIYVTNIVALIGLAIAVDYSMLVVFRYREELAHDRRPVRRARTTMATAGRATLFSGADRRDRPRAARLHAAAVHPLDGRRRPARPGRLDRRLGDAAAGAAGRSWAGGVNRCRVIPRRVLERRAARGDDRHLAPARHGDHAPPGPVLRRRRRDHARARDPGVLAAPHRRRQPRRAADDGVHEGAARPRDDARARARSRRTRSSSTRTVRAAPTAPRSSPPSAASSPSCAAIPRSRRRRSLAPALVNRRASPARPTSSTPTAASCRSAPPAARDSGDAAGDGRSCTACASATSPRPASRPATDVLAERRARVRRRLHRQGLRRVPVARPRGARDLLPAAAARVPLGRPAGQGRRDEPALGRRDLRRARARVRARLGLGPRAAASRPRSTRWIPIFLFAMLFGLSMDYEVFLLSRIREEWDRRHDNERGGRLRPRAHGPDHHGRGDHHDRGVRRASSPAASSGCRSSASGSRRRSCSTRRSSARSSCPATMKLLGRLELVPARARPPRAAAARAAGRAGARGRRVALSRGGGARATGGRDAAPPGGHDGRVSAGVDAR